LSQLREGGVLTSRREGKTVYYRANPAGIATVIAELQAHLQACCPPEEPASRPDV
jgi:DNA-binding transcriptional ArsR family regulator